VLETEALAAYQAMVLDQTTVLLNTLDADGRVVTWNRASEQLLGITAADARGRRFGVDVAILHGASWDDLWAILRRTGNFTGEVADRRSLAPPRRRELADPAAPRGSAPARPDRRRPRPGRRRRARRPRSAAPAPSRIRSSAPRSSPPSACSPPASPTRSTTR
jgi:PAS domain-containing protein